MIKLSGSNWILKLQEYVSSSCLTMFFNDVIRDSDHIETQIVSAYFTAQKTFTSRQDPPLSSVAAPPFAGLVIAIARSFFH